MRLIELEINNIRGICNVTLNPEGNNFVVWGQNGSGKSAVVDALDFLLTGRISRLTGEGTGDIKLDKHGTHIDHEPKDAIVRAVVSIPNYPKPIEIKRCIEHPGVIEYADEEAKQYLGPILSIAYRGQHVLTRREILKYITAEPNNRAQEIQTILDLKDIEDIRKSLTSVDSTCRRENEATTKALRIAEGEVNAIINVKSFDPDALLKFINEKRTFLSAKSLGNVDSKNIKTKISAPIMSSSNKTINIVQFQQDLDHLKTFFTEKNRKEYLDNDKQLRDTINLINSNPNLSESLKRLRLFELGIQLIDDSGACPLCDTQWPPGELMHNLEEKVNLAQTASDYKKDIDEKSKYLVDILTNVLARIKNITISMEIIGLEKERTSLLLWAKYIDKLVESLSSPIENYTQEKHPNEKMKENLFPLVVDSFLSTSIKKDYSQYSKTTPELNAWDTLTTLSSKLESYEKALKADNQAVLIYKRASILLQNFLYSRDNVLQSLYDSVRDRFVEFYRFINQSDEGNFTAKITPDDAGLDFNVSFYSYGEHPPHALHSEGHQDSMGICLYLALTEKLTQGYIDLIILDDVVMSIDMEHRKQICQLLSTCFPNNQFLITTHDRSWANHLRSTNIVNSKGMVQFYNWHVNTGPQVDFEADIWNRISQDLEKDDVASASGKLRSNAEQFFAIVCDYLKAPVVFNINGSYDLGNLLDGAISRYGRLIRKAKEAASSWGDEEEAIKLEEYNEIAKTIYARTNAERWSVNPTIHYNNWANLSKVEFEPVIDAFKDLYGVFICTKCQGLIHVVTSSVGVQESVRCNCPQIDWNLVKKSSK
ncbi:MAG: AAA family ATPase [Dehalococcoidales bacterium]|nr:AAA family ATPase [Dehalococcoidales bacterium]